MDLLINDRIIDVYKVFLECKHYKCLSRVMSNMAGGKGSVCCLWFSLNVLVSVEDVLLAKILSSNNSCELEITNPKSFLLHFKH
jgi:hypothetical protein